MPSYKSSGIITQIAGADLVAHQLVMRSSGKVVETTDENDDAIGAMDDQPDASLNDSVAIKTLNADGTILCIAAGVVAQDAKVYPAAAGEVSTTSGTAPAVGIALNAAAAQGDLIEVLPVNVT